MAIAVELRDERGGVLRRITEGASELAAAMPDFADPDYPMLGFVDPYGDTVFNGRQMTAVLPELRRLGERLPDPPPVLADIESAAREVADGVHLYLVFVGD